MVPGRATHPASLGCRGRQATARACLDLRVVTEDESGTQQTGNTVSSCSQATAAQLCKCPGSDAAASIESGGRSVQAAAAAADSRIPLPPRCMVMGLC